MTSDRKRRGFHPSSSTATRPAPVAEQSKTIVYQTLKGAVAVNEPEPLTLSGNASMEAIDRPTRGDEGEEPRSHTSTYRYSRRNNAQARQQTEPLEEEIPTETRTQRTQRTQQVRTAMDDVQQTARQARTAVPQQYVQRSRRPAPETDEDEAIVVDEVDADIERDIEEAMTVRDRSYARTERRERYTQTVAPDENPYAFKQRRVRQHQAPMVVPSGLNRKERRHSVWTPVLSVTLTILGIAILWIGLYMWNASWANWNLHWNNEASRVVYGTFGHGSKPGDVSRVEVVNDQGRVELLEIVNGDLAHARIVTGPDFSQAMGISDPSNIPLRIEVKDINGDGKLDIVVISTSGNDMIGRPIEQSWVLYNDGKNFVWKRPDELSSGHQSQK